MRQTFFVFAIVIPFLFFTNCTDKKDPTEPEDEKKNVSIAENVKVISGNDFQSALLDVSEDGSEFEFSSQLSDYNLKVGDILVSDHGLGYQKKITNIQEDNNDVALLSFPALYWAYQ